MKKIQLFLILLPLIILVSCTGQPKLIRAMAEPDLADIGETVALKVQFTGSHEDLKNVYLTVREHPYDYPMIKMEADNEEEKNIWIKAVVIPDEAYSGEFHLDINALLKDGGEIITEGFGTNSTGKAGTIILNIK